MLAECPDDGHERRMTEGLREIDALDPRAEDLTARPNFQHHDIPNACCADRSLGARGARAVISGYAS